MTQINLINPNPKPIPMPTKPSVITTPTSNANISAKKKQKNKAKQLSFLPEPKYNPKYPSKRTLSFKALRLMLRGTQIAHPTFEALTGSWRLAAHIHILKRLGWPVESRFQGKKRAGIVYYLPEDLIEMMKGV